MLLCDLFLCNFANCVVLTVSLCQCQTLEKAKGIEVLKEACAACAESILTRKGRMIVKDEARVVSVHLITPVLRFFLPGQSVLF